MVAEKNSSQLAHDIHAELAKIKTSISLMEDSSLEEIQKEFIPMIADAANRLEKLLALKFKS